MELLKRIKQALTGLGGDKPKLRYIGVTSPTCPFCEQSLEKMPEQSQKCPHCGEYVYVRVRPIDERRILVTESQIQIVDEQWAIADGTYEELVARKHEPLDTGVNSRGNKDLKKSLDEVRWSLLQKELLDNKLKSHYGSYRNTLVEMAKLLVREGRLPEALSKYLEVCYLDINGTTNVANVGDQAASPKLSPFVPELSRPDPSIIAETRNLIKTLGLSNEEVQKRFLNSAQAQSITLQPPKPPADVWTRLSQELFD